MEGCSFTGHRSIKAEHRAKLDELLLRAVSYAYEKGCRKFYAGGAIGFDTAAARTVIRFRITHPDARLILLLPCEDQSDRWSDSQRDDYEYTLREANEVVYTSDRYYDGCMKERNKELAERCDVLIAYVGRYNSGAAQTVRMAKELGREVYNLYPALEGKS